VLPSQAHGGEFTNLIVQPRTKVNHTQAKAHCPISLSFMQKRMQIWWQEYQGRNTGACSHIYNNLPSNQGSPQKLQCTMSLQEAVKNRKLILSFPRYWSSFW